MSADDDRCARVARGRCRRPLTAPLPREARQAGDDCYRSRHDRRGLPRCCRSRTARGSSCSFTAAPTGLKEAKTVPSAHGCGTAEGVLALEPYAARLRQARAAKQGDQTLEIDRPMLSCPSRTAFAGTGCDPEGSGARFPACARPGGPGVCEGPQRRGRVQARRRAWRLLPLRRRCGAGTHRGRVAPPGTLP